MSRTERFLLDTQRTLEQRLGLSVTALRGVERREVSERKRLVKMRRTERLLVNAQLAPVDPLCTCVYLFVHADTQDRTALPDCNTGDRATARDSHPRTSQRC